jgi:hypothetical protein
MRAMGFFLLLMLGTRGTFAQPPAEDSPGRWKLETIALKGKQTLPGLVLSQSAAEVEFAQIVQPPGKPMYAVIRPLPRQEVVRVELLPDEDHAALVARFDRFRNRAVIEAGRLEQVQLVHENGTWIYRGTWFDLASTADDEHTSRSILRIEQLFRAYRTLLPPRVQRPQRLQVRLFGSVDEYRSELRSLGLRLDNAAFYSARQQTILAGSDLNLFADRLAQMRKQFDNVRIEYTRLDAEQARTLATLSQDLQKAGYTPDEAAAEVRLRKAVWKQQLEAALAANLARERSNDRKFAEVTEQMFSLLGHEAFHAYLNTFVYPHDRHHVPRWLNEGLAQVFESGQLDGDSLRLDAPARDKLASLQQDLAAGQPLPLARLLEAEEREFLGPHGSGSPSRHYLYAWGLAWHLSMAQNLLGPGKLDEYVGERPGPRDPITRFEQLTGQRLAEFEPAWRRAMLEAK